MLLVVQFQQGCQRLRRLASISLLSQKRHHTTDCCTSRETGAKLQATTLRCQPQLQRLTSVCRGLRFTAPQKHTLVGRVDLRLHVQQRAASACRQPDRGKARDKPAGSKKPPLFARVGGIFHRKGAYSRFKELLSAEGRLEDWYAFEAAETDAALRAWCRENDIRIIEEGTET